MNEQATDFTLDWDEANGTLTLSGPLTLTQIDGAQQQFEQMSKGDPAISEVDLRQLSDLDTAGASLLGQWLRDLPIRYRDQRQQQLIEFVTKLEAPVEKHDKPPPTLRRTITALGQWGSHMREQTREILIFTGKSAIMLRRALWHPHQLRFGAIVQHIEQIGIAALPIIGLMAFLIAIVLAYQGVAQLRPYGGEQFTVNLVAISILREMGVLLTAIMVAGRSGSAFTAEIGVMKAREEIDALQVMGLEPFSMLITPRLIAILFALPLLTFYANIMGLLGGFLIIHSLIGITLEQYIERVHMAVSGSDLFVGLIKAPVFAFFIGIVGCMHGLRVSASAESIGKETTASVVKAIFLVLVLDAFFSIFFEQVGL